MNSFKVTSDFYYRELFYSDRFPGNPRVTPLSASIPSWQLKKNTEEEEKVDEKGEREKNVVDAVTVTNGHGGEAEGDAAQSPG